MGNNRLWRRLSSTTGLMVLLSACATLPVPTAQPLFRAQFSPGSTALTPSQFTQQLHITRGETSADLLGVLQISAHTTTLAVLDATGVMLFSVVRTAAETKVERHPDIPDYVDPLEVLSDVRLINWPSKLLRAALLPDVELTETQQERHLRKNQTLHTSATFSPSRAHWQTASLMNHHYGYTLHITQLPDPASSANLDHGSTP